jgi:hypothetical protein
MIPGETDARALQMFQQVVDVLIVDDVRLSKYTWDVSDRLLRLWLDVSTVCCPDDYFFPPLKCSS